jgi:hypothetical protein
MRTTIAGAIAAHEAVRPTLAEHVVVEEAPKMTVDASRKS